MQITLLTKTETKDIINCIETIIPENYKKPLKPSSNLKKRKNEEPPEIVVEMPVTKRPRTVYSTPCLAKYLKGKDVVNMVFGDGSFNLNHNEIEEA